MLRRTAVEQAVATSLHATSEAQVSDALIHFAEEDWSSYTADPAGLAESHNDLEQAFEIIRSQRQITLAALGELASHSIVKTMSERLDRDGNLFGQPEHESSAGGSVCDPKTTSPSLRRLLTVMNDYFAPAYDELFTKARQGQMPHAAIMAVGADVSQTYRWIDYAWAKDTCSPLARARHESRFRRKIDPLLTGTFTDAARRPFRVNLGIAAELIIGRGVAHSLSASTLSKADFIRKHFEELARLSSAVWAIASPIVGEEEHLALYSQWERGEINAAEFYAEAVKNPSSTQEPFFHKALKDGPLQHAGHCVGDVAYTDIDAFPASPVELMRKLGIDPPAKTSMVHILLGGVVELSPYTIFAHWPEDSRQ